MKTFSCSSHQGTRGAGVQAQEIIVWTEAISKVLEHEVLPVYRVYWF